MGLGTRLVCLLCCCLCACCVAGSCLCFLCCLFLFVCLLCCLFLFVCLLFVHFCSLVVKYKDHLPHNPGDAVGIAKVKPLFLETKPANLKVPRTRYIMDCLMHVMTSQVGRIQWADPNHHFRGFAFLYHQFKLRYLAPLYKDFRFARQIYLPGTSGSTSMEPISVASPSNPASLPGKGDRISSLIRLAYDTSDPIYSQTKQLVLQKILNWLLYRSSERLLVNIPDDLTQEMLHSGSYPSQLNGVDLLNKMHFSTCDNITLLLEMLRQVRSATC